MGAKHILVNGVPFNTDHMVINLTEITGTKGVTRYGYSVEDIRSRKEVVYSIYYDSKTEREENLVGFIQAFQAIEPGPQTPEVFYKFYI